MRRMSGLIPTFIAENEDHDPEEDSPRGLFGYNPRTGSFTLENVKQTQRELRPRSPSVLGLGNVEAERYQYVWKLVLPGPRSSLNPRGPRKLP